MPDSSDNVNSGARASVVDWSRPIEAVHEDGSVIKAFHTDEMIAGDQSRWVRAAFDDGSSGHWFNPNGNANHTRWRIRNILPTSVKWRQATSPDRHPVMAQGAGTTPELDPALWDRMVALVRNMVREDTAHWSGDYVIARAIVADLPKPVDPDLIEARQLAVTLSPVALGAKGMEAFVNGDNDDWPQVYFALAGIRRGRELATPEVSHVG